MDSVTDDVLQYLKKRPATIQELMDEFSANRDDVHNRLRTLLNRKLVYVANEPPRWFAKSYALPDDASNELIRQRLIAYWTQYDPTTDIAVPLNGMVTRVKQILDLRPESANKIIATTPTGEAITKRDAQEAARTLALTVDKSEPNWFEIGKYDPIANRNRTPQELEAFAKAKHKQYIQEELRKAE